MLRLGRMDIRHLVVVIAISMAFLMMVSLPQLNASPVKGEARLLEQTNSKEVSNSTAPTPDQSILSLPTQKVAADQIEESSIYRTFTDTDCSLAALNSALASCPSGQEVRLAAGNYTFNGIINIPAGKTLSGTIDKSGEIATVISTSLTDDALLLNGYIDIGTGRNAVKNIKTQDGYFFSGVDSQDFLFQNCEYNGPTDSGAGQFNLCGFIIYMANSGNYDNGRFVGCVAKGAPGFGFLISADAAKNSDRVGPNAYSSHDWQWSDCKAYDCGVANINFPGQFVYGCGFDFFEGFGPRDEVSGMRITKCTADGNAADGFHIEYMMDIVNAIFEDCTANNNGQWFKTGKTSNPQDGVLIGTGFYLGGSEVSQTKVINSNAQDNWGYSTHGGGHGIVDSQMNSDLGGVFGQHTKTFTWKS